MKTIEVTYQDGPRQTQQVRFHSRAAWLKWMREHVGAIRLLRVWSDGLLGQSDFRRLNQYT